MAAINSNSENWAGHTKKEVENHIKARLNSTIAASSIKALGFSQDVMYNPATDTYPTYIEMLQSDGTYAIKSDPTKTTVSSSHYLISMRLKNAVEQLVTTSNAWYPIAIAGRQYSNMTNGNCLPIYYSSKLSLNPSLGQIRLGSNYAVASNIQNFQIKVVSSLPSTQEQNILYIVVS